MKKIIFSIVGSLLISLCAVQAQQYDTAGRARNDQQDQQRSEQMRQQREQQRSEQMRQQRQQRDQARQQREQQSDRSQTRDAYANQGMVIIEKDELPESVKQTLQQDKYEGWENSKIYHNTNTGEYIIAPRAHRFDAEGKEIEAGNAAYGQRDGRKNRYSQDQSQKDQAGQNQQYDQSSQGQAEDRSSQSQQQSEAYRNAQSHPQDQQQNDQSQQNDQTSEDRAQANEQQPSRSYRTEQDNQSSRQRDDQSTQPESQYRTDEMVEIQAEQIPKELRSTLRQRKYKGWEENGTLYQEPATGEYVLVMEKADDPGQPQAYRFDNKGQLKNDQTGENRRNNGQ